METCPYQLVGIECSEPRFNGQCISLINEAKTRDGLEQQITTMEDDHLKGFGQIYTSPGCTCALKLEIISKIKQEFKRRGKEF
jgi:hypothetical protein